MLTSIYASKLYRASSRKDKINAAFDDPVNSELVGQLAKALDEEYQTPDYLVKNQDESHESKGSSSDQSASDDSSNQPLASPAPSAPRPSGAPSRPPESSSEPEDTSTEESTTVNIPDSAEGSPSTGGESGADAGAVTESTSLTGSRIVGSEIRCEFRNMRQVADQIKGMLNFKDSTQGVNRILGKENELWIYYNDDINLNNVMSDVIELLNASSYYYLEFNRLARTDNAIVFQVDFADTANVMRGKNSTDK